MARLPYITIDDGFTKAKFEYVPISDVSDQKLTVHQIKQAVVWGKTVLLCKVSREGETNTFNVVLWDMTASRFRKVLRWTDDKPVKFAFIQRVE